MRRLLGLAALAALLGCAGGGSPLETGSEASITGIVGPGGGTVRLGDRVTVVFPPGALSAPTAITIRAIEPSEFLVAAGGIGPAFQIEPNGLVLGSAASVTILVPEDIVRQVADRLGLITSAHPLFTGPAAFRHLAVFTQHPAGGGVILTAPTLHLGPVQPAVL